MNRFRYTASGRLGIWDSFDKQGMEKWRSKLGELLRSNAHGVIESDVLAFTETDDPALAAITAVCDKIIARGNPTLVDPNWERILLSGPGSEFLHWEEPDDTEVKFCVKEFLLPEGTSSQLLNAAKDLLDLGWSDEVPAPRQRLPNDVRKLCSTSEDLLYDSLAAALGSGSAGVLQRQSLISDLVDKPVPNELDENRVDFALQLSGGRWVIEVDGPEHGDPGQHEKDRQRDLALHAGGWGVWRVSNETVRFKRDNWIQEKLANAGIEALVGPTQRSVVVELEKSLIHRAAWHLLFRPLAVQRCLRGLLLLYRYGLLDAAQPQRILVVEEDMPAVADAFHMLRDLWESVNALKPGLGIGPPTFSLDVIGRRRMQRVGLRARYVERPEGNYDAVISHSLLLGEGHPGPLLSQVAPELAHGAIRIRRAMGRHADRRLLWSRGFNYGLDDSCEMQTDELRRLLQIVFRKRNFRDGQLRSITRLLRGKPTIALLPTGGGKSLIYQFAGMLLPGITAIVDPIIALMDDQVYNLRRMGIDRIEGISNQLSSKDRDAVLQRMAGGELSYVFISPERLQSKEFRIQLQQAKSLVPISLAILDEAHCLSEWGHDFRPAYLRLPQNLQNYCKDKDTDDIPTLAALTGTASYAVLEDMQAELELHDEDAIIRPASFDRIELHFDVRQVSRGSHAAELQLVREKLPERWNLDSKEFFQQGCGNRTNCGLVFCPHVNGDMGVVAVAAGLDHTDYYAGKQPKGFRGDWNKRKQDMQSGFIRSEIQELVATKAFGMGIDKPNIRYTVHFGAPSSVEQFYQEAGRAGRNGKKGYALCTVIFCPADKEVHEWFLSNSHKGSDKEKSSTFKLWQKWLAGRPGGSLQTVQIPFGGDEKTREKYMYRLAVLGIVEDYTVDWNTREFEVNVRDADADRVRTSLSNYLGRYKFQDYVDRQLSRVCASDPLVMVEQAIGVLVDFIYDEVVAKRKEAIRNIVELCSTYEDSDSFRREILNYLEDSPFTKQLDSWRGRSFEDVGLETVRSVVTRLAEPREGEHKSQLRALLGTTRRMLEADPGNVALRYLSVIARSMSTWESDRSVIDETVALLAALRGESKLGNLDVCTLQHELLHDIFQRRPLLAGSVAKIMVADEDGLRFARLLLGVGHKYGNAVRLAALNTVGSNVVESVSRIISFYGSEPLGGQDDT